MPINLFEAYALCIIVFLFLEFYFPRKESNNNNNNWLVNYGLYLVNLIIRPLTAPFLIIFSDIVTYQPSEVWSTLPTPITVIVSILVIDVFIYWQHRLFHTVSVLWRCHLVHHSDTEMNVSTNFRLHPLEFIITSALMSLFLYALKLPEYTLVIYFFVSTLIAMWHHSDIKHLPLLERLMQPIFVTPEIHRLHHSINSDERNSNYGTVFSIWDKIFLTYTAPKSNESDVTFGLEYFRENKNKTFINVLLQPKNYKQKKP